jgi:hypothetical protein
MSTQVYRVEFPQKSVLEKIRDLVNNLNTCETMIKPIGDVIGSLPEKVYETPLKVDTSPLSVFFSLWGDGLIITMAEPGYNEGTCQAVVTEFVQNIYKKATTKELPRENIRINTLGTLKIYYVINV